MFCRLSYPHLQAIPFVKHLRVFATENSLESAGNCVRTRDRISHVAPEDKQENFHFSNSTPTSWSQAPLTKTGSLCLGWNEGVVKNKSSSSHPPWPVKGEGPIQRVGQLECCSPWLLWKEDNARTGPLHRMALSNRARRTCCIRLNTQLLAAIALSLWLLLWAVAPSSIKWDSNTCPSYPRGTGNIKVNDIWKSTWKRVLGTILIILGFLWLWAYCWAC